MKRLAVVLFALAVWLSLSALAQDTSSSSSSQQGSFGSASDSAGAGQSSTSPQQGSSGSSSDASGAGQSSTSSQGSTSSTGNDTSSQSGAAAGGSMSAGSASDSGKSAGKAKLKHLKGTIGQDGKTFTTDKGSKSWTIMNPEAVQGHEGHHVVLSAHVYPDKDSVHVMAVKMAGSKGESSGGSKKGSSSDSGMSEKPPR